MALMDPKEFLERLNAHSEEEKLRIVSMLMQMAEDGAKLKGSERSMREKYEEERAKNEKLAAKLTALQQEQKEPGAQQAETDILKKKLREQVDVNKELLDKLMRYETQIREAHSATDKAAALEAELKQKEKALAGLEDECQRLRCVIDLGTGEQAQCKEQQAALEKVIAEKKALDETVGKLTAELEQMKRRGTDAVSEETAMLQNNLYKLNMFNISLREENDALREKTDALEKEAEELRKKLSELTFGPGVPVRKRIEDVLAEYLDTLSAEAEQQLAERFRETALVLMNCSAEDAAKVMQSPLIGTENNKYQLRNQARRSGRTDIAQSI